MSDKDNKGTVFIDFGTHITTIDVKGIAGTTLWPMDNFGGQKPHHYIVLVSFVKKIDNPSVLPEVYIVPSADISSLLYHNPKGNRQGILRSTFISQPGKYLDLWDCIV